jgi:TldD protein
MIALRRREHARAVGVTVRRGARPATWSERCEFTGGRDDLGRGRTTRVFGGVADDLRAPQPPWPADEREVEEKLLRFAGWIGDAVTLHHRTVASGRLVAAGDQAVSAHVGSVFALTGEARAGDGRALPIGFSGPGSGRAVLEEPALAEAVAWARATLATADGPVTGRLPAVLSPQAAAVVVHEAVGHYAEAPHVGAPAVHRLFTRIASECLSVVDGAPTDESGRHPHHDDEGVLRLGSIEIVARGVLVAQLHSRATARAAAAPPTGNARAALVWDPPIPRMSNVVCCAGERPAAALVEDLASGVYIHRLADGYRQGARVSARVVLGEHVSRGRRTGRYFTGG